MPQPRMHSNKSSTSAVIGWLDWAISRRHWTLRSGIPWSSSCWNTNYTASKNMYRSMCLLTATVVSQLLHVSACIYCFTQSSSSGMRVIYHNWSATKQRPHPQSVAEISRHSVLSYTSMGMIWVKFSNCWTQGHKGAVVLRDSKSRQLHLGAVVLRDKKPKYSVWWMFGNF